MLLASFRNPKPLFVDPVLSALHRSLNLDLSFEKDLLDPLLECDSHVDLDITLLVVSVCAAKLSLDTICRNIKKKIFPLFVCTSNLCPIY